MTREGTAEILLPKGTHRYRDELNFAEFPIASVADTIAGNQKSLEFSDEIFDPSTGKTVTRTLSITAADKFGLPTALDDEVLLGLIQLSCDRGFAGRKVYFSRYELIKLLGWRDDSKSYRRIEESLNRWTGVTLQYRRAWWSKEEQCWVNETFHVIDQVTVYDRERIARRRAMAKDSPEKALSSFVWNETVFQSFQAGYIKALDFDFYKSLRSAVSKRMFRFLDKRFYHKPRWEFDLRAFACEHIGLSKGYTNSELKRKLLPAVRELEEQNYLEPLPGGGRFVQVRAGSWTVVLIKARKKLAVLAQGEGSEQLVQALVARGITQRSATKLVAHHLPQVIEEKIRLFDSLKGKAGGGAIRNRAGWLYSAIVHDYATADPAPLGGVRESPTRAVKVAFAPVASEPNGAEVAFDLYWASLSATEQEAFEAAAVGAAAPFLQKQYGDGGASRGSLWRATRRRVLTAHYQRLLPNQPGSGEGE